MSLAVIIVGLMLAVWTRKFSSSDSDDSVNSCSNGMDRYVCGPLRCSLASDDLSSLSVRATMHCVPRSHRSSAFQSTPAPPCNTFLTFLSVRLSPQSNRVVCVIECVINHYVFTVHSHCSRHRSVAKQ